MDDMAVETTASLMMDDLDTGPRSDHLDGSTKEQVSSMESSAPRDGENDLLKAYHDAFDGVGCDYSDQHAQNIISIEFWDVMEIIACLKKNAAQLKDNLTFPASMILGRAKLLLMFDDLLAHDQMVQQHFQEVVAKYRKAVAQRGNWGILKHHTTDSELEQVKKELKKAERLYQGSRDRIQEVKMAIWDLKETDYAEDIQTIRDAALRMRP